MPAQLAPVCVCMQGRAKFEEEMRTTAAVGDHPNLVRVIGVCEDGDDTLIVLDRADGRCLRRARCPPARAICFLTQRPSSADDLMRAGRLPTELSRLKMLRGAAAGVLHMHRKGVLHRDIRRANVLLGEGDRALLADLGLARFVRQGTQSDYTKEGAALPARWTAPVCQEG
jgi:serine/threonine protein kinase